MKYRKKPVIVDAFEWTVDEAPDWWKLRSDINVEVDTCTALIPTLEGIMRATPGDFIIRGIRGEIYPCNPDIFEATYEKVVD